MTFLRAAEGRAGSSYAPPRPAVLQGLDGYERQVRSTDLVALRLAHGRIVRRRVMLSG
jgi:hypothetical protein